MKALVLNALGRGFDLDEVEIASPTGREVLVDVQASGLCHTDLLAGAARIVVIDIHPKRLEAARGFGATDVIDSTKSQPVDAVRDLLPGGSVAVGQSIMRDAGATMK